MNTLIVEDTPQYGSAMERALHQFGHQSRLALSAEAALEIIQQEKFDCALVDYLLPGIDGLDFVREIRRLGHETGIVMITGENRTSVDKQIEANLDVWATLYKTATPKTIDEKLRESCEFMKLSGGQRKRILLGLDREIAEARKLTKKH